MASEEPDELSARYSKAWAKFDRDARRRVMRAVNRMQPLEHPAEAALAVVYARRQRRMWIRWWWVLPVVNGLVAIPRGWAAVAVNVAVGAFLIGMFASLFTWRAGRAAQANLAVVEQARTRKRSGSPRKRAGGSTSGSPGKRAGGSTKASPRRRGKRRR